MKKYYSIIILLLSVIFLQCSSGKKAYEQGNYYSAVMKAVSRLRQNPNHKKSQETLKSSYPLAIKEAQDKAVNSLTSNAPFKYRDALRSYQQLNVLYNNIKRSPGALRVIPNPKNFHSKVAGLKQNAAKESYDAGILALKTNNREDAKTAYYNFVDANEFVPGYKDVRKKMKQAKFDATLKVIVEQIPVPTRYTLSSRFFQDKIEEHLQNKFKGNEFVRFYTPRQADSEKLPYVDQYVRLQFDDFKVGETHTEKTIETVSKDSVKVGTTTNSRGVKIPVYNTVKAKLTIWRKEVVSNGLFSMRIVNGDKNAVLSHKKFNGEFIWFSEWGSFNGDERALDKKQLKICERSEVPPPPAQDMFIEFTKPIYDQLLPAINSFYSKY